MPLVASEKNVDACVVSSVLDSVYDDWTERPWLQLRRTSTMSALYQLSPSLLFSSIVPKLRVRTRQAGGEEQPAVGAGVGVGMLMSVLRNRCVPRDPA